jgi:DNA-binding NarL/FixJ family response regulator
MKTETSAPTTVSVVEDDEGSRESLRALIAKTRGLRCVSAHASAEEALKEIPVSKPDVVLVDISLGGGMDGIRCVTLLKRQDPELKMLMLTRHMESDLILSALRAGASGYLLKKMIPGELITAIEQVKAGGAPMSMQIAREVVNYFHRIQQPASDLEKLTKREQEVLALLAKGYLYKEIAATLAITLDTVRVHAKHIYEKLHVHSRMEAALKFLGSE